MVDEVHQALYAQTQVAHQGKVRRYVRAIFRLVWEWFLRQLRQAKKHYDVALETDVVSSYENFNSFCTKLVTERFQWLPNPSFRGVMQ